MADIQYELKTPFEYTPLNSGDLVKASFITLKEPSVKNLAACAPLKQAFMQAIAGQEDVSSNTSSQAAPADVPMADVIINALYASDVDMAKVWVSARELFKDVALIEGEKKMTVPLLDAMSIDDLEAMTGKYMENFILASVLKEQ